MFKTLLYPILKIMSKKLDDCFLACANIGVPKFLSDIDAHHIDVTAILLLNKDFLSYLDPTGERQSVIVKKGSHTLVTFEGILHITENCVREFIESTIKDFDENPVWWFPKKYRSHIRSETKRVKEDGVTKIVTFVEFTNYAFGYVTTMTWEYNVTDRNAEVPITMTKETKKLTFVRDGGLW